MLINLHIKNLALIDELDIDFGKGLSILTGETGAGKSIIIGSIGIGLGGKFSRELLRDPEKEGLVELTFDVNDIIKKYDKSQGRAGDISDWDDGCEGRSGDISGEDDGNEDIAGYFPDKDNSPEGSVLHDMIRSSENGILTISRKLSNDRTINRINGETVTVKQIRELAETLINLHAQHEQTTLLHEEKHIEILDSSSIKLQELKDAVREAYVRYSENHSKLGRMNISDSERAKRADFLRFEENEIESARLMPGEDEELEMLFTRMNNSREICEAAESVYGCTGYDAPDSAGSQISRSLQKLKSVERLDRSAEPLISQLTDIEAILNEFNHSLSEYISDASFDEKTFTETEQRLNLINGLKAKYGRTTEDILQSLEVIKAELKELDDYEENLRLLKENDGVLYKELCEKCSVLTEARKKAAETLSQSITEALRSLNFNEVIFYMEFGELSECTADGRDSICFMISTNVGEAPKPLHMVASGGELSRIMLAVKSVLADTWETPTLIFDEVDTGISGITAKKVAEMMKELSATHQIISITHLPQIAAKADNSFLIEKTVSDGRTYTRIRPIDGDERVMEIARLLGGDNVSESVISAARELLK